jgi:hypothetical protein
LSGIAVVVPAEFLEVSVAVVLLGALVQTIHSPAWLIEPRHVTFCTKEIENVIATVVGAAVPVFTLPNELPDPDRIADPVPATMLVGAR